MKKAIKFAAIFSVLVTSAVAVKAQTTTDKSNNGMSLSVGIESGISTGDLKNDQKTNVGATVQADIPVSNHFYAIFNTGYRDFIGRDNVNNTGLSAADIHVIPMMAGLKYFPVSNFYVQASAGTSYLLNRSEVGFDNRLSFAFAPEVGVQLPVTKKSYINAGIRYEGTTSYESDFDGSKLNFVGLRVAYGFGL
jgi:hypothetical protein